MKKTLLALLLGAFSIGAMAQTTATVTGTATDADGQTWNNGTWTATFVSPNAPPTIGGVPLNPSTNPTTVTGIYSSAGALSTTLTKTNAIDQSGAYWQIVSCPNASAACAAPVTTTITGTTDISSALSAGLAGPRFQQGTNSYGYADVEVLKNSLPDGSIYYSVTCQCVRSYSTKTQSWTGVSGNGTVAAGTGIGYYNPAGGTTINGANITGLVQANGASAPTAAIPNVNYLVPITSFGVICDGLSHAGNDAAMTSALASGQYVINSPSATCVVAQPHSICSNTVLDLNYGTYSFPTTTGTILDTCSHASSPTVLTAACGMTAGSSLLTCTGNPFTSAMVGTESAYVIGANYPDEAASTLFATITGFTDSNNVTLSQSAYQTVSGATVNLYVRDHDIGIKNGTIAGNPSSTRNGNKTTYLWRVDRLRLENLIATGTNGEFAFFVQDADGFVAKDITCAQTSADCIDVGGPNSNPTVTNLHCIANGDDCLATFGHASPTAFNNTVYGPVTNCLYSFVYASGVADTMRFSSVTPTAQIAGCEAHHIYTNKSAGIFLQDTVESAPYNVGGYADQMHFHDVFQYNNPNATIYAPVESTITYGGSLSISDVDVNNSIANTDGAVHIYGNWKKVTVRNLHAQNPASSWKVLYLDGSNSGTNTTSIGQLNVSNISWQPANGTVGSGSLIDLRVNSIGTASFSGLSYNNGSATAGTVTGLSTFSTYPVAADLVQVDGLQMDCTGSTICNGINWGSGGTVKNLNIRGAQSANAGSSGTLFTMASTSVINHWSLSNCGTNGGQYLVNQQGLDGPGVISTCYADGSTRFGEKGNATTSGSVMDWTLLGVGFFNTTSPGIEIADNTQVANIIRGAGVAATSSTHLTRSGSAPHIEVRNPSFHLDFAQTGTDVTSETMAYNTNSAADVIGTVFGATGKVPSMAAGAAAGTSPTCTTITGTNYYGTLACTTGTSTTTGALATITFSQTLSSAPYGCILLPRTSTTSSSITSTGSSISTGTPSTTSWTIVVASAALAPSTTFSWVYQCK